MLLYEIKVFFNYLITINICYTRIPSCLRWRSKLNSSMMRPFKPFEDLANPNHTLGDVPQQNLYPQKSLCTSARTSLVNYFLFSQFRFIFFIFFYRLVHFKHFKPNSISYYPLRYWTGVWTKSYAWWQICCGWICPSLWC